MRTVKRWLRKILFMAFLLVSFLALFIEGPSGLLGLACTVLALVTAVMIAVVLEHYEEMILLFGKRGEKYSVADLVMDGLLLCARTQERMVCPVLVHPSAYAPGVDVAETSQQGGRTGLSHGARMRTVRSGRRHF